MTLTGLSNGVRYQMRVRAGNGDHNGTSWGPWSQASDDVWPNRQYTLTASSVTTTTATLTIGNHPYDWYIKRTAPTSGACSANVGASRSTDLSSLTAATTYTYKAYSLNGCPSSHELATVTFTAGVSLTPSSLTTTTATVTLAGHTGNWWLKETSPATGACAAGEADFSHALSSLTSGTTYTYTAYSDSACADSIASAQFTTVSLSAGSITATGATLTITGHSGNWHAQETAPGTGTCSAAITGTTHALSSLTPGTAYTYGAYSDSSCTTGNLLDTTTFTTSASLTASAITDTTATLTLAGRTGNWWLKETSPDTGACASGEADFSHALSSLTASTSYTYTAYSASTCATANEVASETFTTAATATLTASDVTATSATLTLANRTGNWWLRETAPSTGACAAGEADFSHDLTSLAAGAVLTYTAYSDSACATALASETFATLVTLSNLTTGGPGTANVDSSSGESSRFVTGGNAGGYTIESVDVNITSVTNTTGNASGDLTVALYTSASNGKPGTSQATLSGSSPTGAGTFTFTCPANANCSLSPATEYHVVLTAPNTTGNGKYVWTSVDTYTAVQEPSDNGWFILSPHYQYAGIWQNTSDPRKIKVAAAADPSLTVSSITATGATLTLSHYTGGAWWHKGSQANASCAPVAAGTTTATLSSLTSGTSYTYKAYDTSACASADEIAAAAAFTAGSAPTLTAGTPSASKNTLTLANWNGVWSYKHGNSDGVCAPVAAGTTTLNLTGLSVNTSYTYTAYSDGACTAVIAAASEFTTGNPSLSVAFSSSGSDIIAKLTLSGWAAGQGAGKDGIWYYKYTVPTGGTCSFPRSNQQSGNITVTGGTSYTFKAYSLGTCASGSEIASLTVTVSGPDSVGAQVRDVNKNRLVASDNKLQVWWKKPTWAAATDSFSYTVDCSTSASAPYTWTSACGAVAATTNASAMATVSTTGVTRVRVRGTLGVLNHPVGGIGRAVRDGAGRADEHELSTPRPAEHQARGELGQADQPERGRGLRGPVPAEQHQLGCVPHQGRDDRREHTAQPEHDVLVDPGSVGGGRRGERLGRDQERLMTREAG